MTSSSYVLVIPYELKEAAKDNKCQWDKENKYWYMKSHNDDHELMKFADDYSRVNLNVPFDQKDIVKQNGGMWDMKQKIWYTYKCNAKLQNFMKFSDKNETEKEKILEKKKVKDKEKNKIKKEFLTNGGTEEEFGPWYSVNILGHE